MSSPEQPTSIPATTAMKSMNPPGPGDQIILQVGERRFTTTYDTLVDGSAYFKALLSGRWSSKNDDGSYFIDADPNTFEHVLKYLRSGVFPVFYDETTGHDYTRYTDVLEQARYFGIDSLEEWVTKCKYVAVVTISYSAKEGAAGLLMGFRELPLRTTSDVEVTYKSEWRTRTVQVCPMNSQTHDDCPGRCARVGCHSNTDLSKFAKTGKLEREETDLHLFTVQKTTHFHHALCLEGGT